jgi:uncharacterized membrane protein YozB (DUF420 family)
MQSIFPGSAAPLAAECVLLIELAMGLALVAGAVLARRRRYRAHAWCQSIVVLLNLPLVAYFMARSFWSAVAPGLLARPGRSYYWLAAVHGVLGTSAELFGLYVLVSAGTNLLPQRFRLTRYKLWMGSLLALWWVVLCLGLATYVRWYGLPFRPRAEDGTTSSLRHNSEIRSLKSETHLEFEMLWVTWIG